MVGRWCAGRLRRRRCWPRRRRARRNRRRVQARHGWCVVSRPVRIRTRPRHVPRASTRSGWLPTPMRPSRRGAPLPISRRRTTTSTGRRWIACDGRCSRPMDRAVRGPPWRATTGGPATSGRALIVPARSVGATTVADDEGKARRSAHRRTSTADFGGPAVSAGGDRRAAHAPWRHSLIASNASWTRYCGPCAPARALRPAAAARPPLPTAATTEDRPQVFADGVSARRRDLVLNRRAEAHPATHGRMTFAGEAHAIVTQAPTAEAPATREAATAMNAVPPTAIGADVASAATTAAAPTPERRALRPGYWTSFTVGLVMISRKISVSFCS